MAKLTTNRLTILAGAVVGVAVVATAIVVARPANHDDCDPVDFPTGHSVARLWNEVALDAIRRDLPAPTVHARNLFHLSVAMWDAWAAYDQSAGGYLVTEKPNTSNPAEARIEALSYAAYRVLEHRYIDSVGATDSILEFDALMDSLCLPIENTTADGDSPKAVGNRIAAAVIEAGRNDGSNEVGGYDDPSYIPVNPPLVVARPGTAMTDPNRWQPLQLGMMISQNGIPVENASQEFIDPHWGHVDSFALPPSGDAGLPLDPGAPPYLGDPISDQDFKDSAVEVIRYSGLLDPAADVEIDISPAAFGGSRLGTNDGSGYPMNPVSGEPYAPNVVNQADYGRAAAEFWADGPNSETPPGHWNTLANAVSDLLAPDLRIGGVGAAVDRLEWDVKLYLALNAANHDAAIAAWGAKRFFDYARPISMIRYMGGLGQSTDPALPSYHKGGLPLVPDVVELITQETTTLGGRHERLAGYEGDIAVRAWLGTPEHPENETAGVDWMLAADWVPYQLPTFVTPSFAAYVSGHSAFSRASADIMAAFTGSPYFPRGLGEWTVPAGSFEFEAGPAEDVVLQWAAYGDAADQAGLSRLYGGIHVRADDLAGRRMGAEIAQRVWSEAQRYYGNA